MVRRTRLLSISAASLFFAFSAFAEGYPATLDDLRGMSTTSACSGVLVNLHRGREQPAVLLTSGRCATKREIPANDAIVDEPYGRETISIFIGNETAEAIATSRVLYATRTGSDLALIELKSTYRELEAKGAKIYDLSGADAKPMENVQLLTARWREKQLCAVSHTVASLLEGIWTTHDSFALKDPCPSVGGWAGTPMLDPTTMNIVGLLNTTNTGGQPCSNGNPCEVAGRNRTAFRGRTYGQRTALILDCLDQDGEIDLLRSGCKLAKPKSQATPPASKQGGSPQSGRHGWPKANRLRRT